MKPERTYGAPVRRVPPTRAKATLVVSLAAAIFIPAVWASAQAVPTTGSAQETQPSATSGTGRTVTTPASTQDLNGAQPATNSMQISVALPASQIISILQQMPQVVVELKSLMADQMQQSGAQVQPDDITDEMLYSQIQSSADLRARITTFLRARGYVSDDDLQTLASSVEDPDAMAGLASARSAGLLSDASGGLGRNSASGLAALENGYALSSSGRGTASGALSAGTLAGRDEAKRRDQDVSASTDEPKVLRSPAPFNLQSMRDLYTQIPEPSVPLKRFGSEVFVNRDTFGMARGGAARDTPLDVPLGPDYVVGPGDTLTITLWGGTTQNITRIVDRDGRILVPEAGSIDVAGSDPGARAKPGRGRAEAAISKCTDRRYGLAVALRARVCRRRCAASWRLRHQLAGNALERIVCRGRPNRGGVPAHTAPLPRQDAG